MSIYTVTAANWNSPAFWSSISESGAGHTLDFSALGSGFTVNIQNTLGYFTISDGSTTYTVGESGYAGGADALLGGSTLLDFFSILSLTQGDDRAFGTSANDTISGNGGADTIMAGAGNDSVLGGDGDDSIMAESGNDTVRGGEGNDYIAHSTGSDLLYGDAGDDTIYGGGTSASGHDTLYGGTGDDLLSGVLGNDAAYGEAGNDTLIADHGDDTLDGGADADVFRVQDNWGYDTITGGETTTTGIDNDTLDLSGLSAPVDVYMSGDERGSVNNNVDVADFAEIERLVLTGFDDQVKAANDNAGTEYDAGAGNDTIAAGGGNDSIFGGEGNDELYGDYPDATHEGQELLQNGSFEHGSHSADTVNGLDNWTVFSGSPDSPEDGGSSESWNPALDASDGTGYVTMWANPTSTSEAIQQTLATPLTSGTNYTFSVNAQSGDYVGGQWFTPTDIPVTLEIFDVTTGTVLGTATVQGTTYQTYSFNFTPTINVTTIGIRPNGQGVGTYPSVTIDEVHLFETSVTAQSGDDTLEGGFGDDTITTGDGEDVIVLSDGSGVDRITDFDFGDDDLDGFYNDQFDVSNLTDSSGNPVNSWDVVVSDDGFGNARLAFPNGEMVILEGIAPSQIDEAHELYAAGIPCFAAGTLIETSEGERRIEDLRPGDLVKTRDDGLQPIRWIGCREHSREELRTARHLAPVHIPEGVLGNHSSLLVSPLHGMLVGQRQGAEEPVLVHAKHLVDVAGPVRFAKGKKSVRYHHILLPRHGILFANGAPSESFYPGIEALCLFGANELATLARLLPGILTNPVAEIYGPKVHEFLRRKDVLARISLRKQSHSSMVQA